jgi:hypothetical protein
VLSEVGSGVLVPACQAQAKGVLAARNGNALTGRHIRASLLDTPFFVLFFRFTVCRNFLSNLIKISYQIICYT